MIKTGTKKSDKVGFIIMFCIPIFTGISLIGWGIWDASKIPIEPPRPPDGVPLDVSLGVRDGNDYELPALYQLFAIPYMDPVTITIDFPERFSFAGRWNGSEAKFNILEPYSTELTAETHTDTWDESLYGKDESYAPFLKVTFSIDEENYHRAIKTKAELEILYPLQTKSCSLLECPQGVSGYFSNNQDLLARQIDLFVVSPEEYALLEKNLEDYKRWMNNSQNTGWRPFHSFCGGIGVLLILLGLFFIYSIATDKITLQ